MHMNWTELGHNTMQLVISEVLIENEALFLLFLLCHCATAGCAFTSQLEAGD